MAGFLVRLAICLFGLSIASACAPLFEGGLDRAQRLASAQGWHARLFDTSSFAVYGFVKDSRGQTVQTVSIYLEGDGEAWHDRFTPPVDPTPWDPIGLRLALADPAPSSAYLARPCQYVARIGGRATRNCNPRYWTVARFAPEVIAAVDEAISHVKRHYGATGVRLFGYSGGGVLAALIAERREDIEFLVTVAAPLDLSAWTAHHRLTPLTDSRAPGQESSRLNHLAQVHFVGKRDDIVPASVVQSFLRRFGEGDRATLIAVPEFGHVCCWAEQWPSLLAQALKDSSRRTGGGAAPR